jgi:hypothetical protein
VSQTKRKAIRGKRRTPGHVTEQCGSVEWLSSVHSLVTTVRKYVKGLTTPQMKSVLLNTLRVHDDSSQSGLAPI